MILPLHEQLKARVRAILAEAARPRRGRRVDDRHRNAAQPHLGDLGTPVAFELARRLRKAPRAIAQELAARSAPIGRRARRGRAERLPERLPRSPGVPAAPGSACSARLPAPPPQAGKTIVEHTAINPNKAAHIGHLRNSALGDTLVRVLRFRGIPVEVQNYIDDTGVQVADVVVGFQRARAARRSTTSARIADSTRFDYYCWDLYARVTEWYDGDKERLKIRAATLHDIEHGGNPTAEHRRRSSPIASSAAT